MAPGATTPTRALPATCRRTSIRFRSISIPTGPRAISGGEEIWNYIRDTAKKYGILQFIKFNTAINGAAWDDDAQLWKLETEDGAWTANFVIGAMGPLSTPQIPQLPGIENFEGASFHSREWDHGYDLKDKRVAVVGTGASAIQLVPQIVDEVKELHLYQRTAAVGNAALRAFVDEVRTQAVQVPAVHSAHCARDRLLVP